MIRTIYSRRSVWLIVHVAVALFGVAAPAILLVWQTCTPLVAVQRSDLGTFVSATTNSGGLFSPTYSSIQTTVATVAVKGAISAARGQKLSIETLNKIGVQLCVDDELENCVPLASPWLGSLKATPQAVTVPDFQRFGLTTANVDGWFWLGVLLLVIAFILAYEHSERFGEDGRRVRNV